MTDSMRRRISGVLRPIFWLHSAVSCRFKSDRRAATSFSAGFDGNREPRKPCQGADVVDGAEKEAAMFMAWRKTKS